MPRPPILISGPYRRRSTEKIRSVLLACAIGVVIGAMLVLGLA